MSEIHQPGEPEQPTSELSKAETTTPSAIPADTSAAIPAVTSVTVDELLDTPNLSTSLNSRSAKGGAALMFGEGVRYLVTFVKMMILARILSKEDFGLVAMVYTVTRFLDIFRDIGLSKATSQAKQITRAQVSSLFWLNAAIGFGLFAMGPIFGSLMAWFYDREELMKICAVVCSSFLFLALGNQHQALLERQMRHDKVAIARTAGPVANAVVAVLAALMGAGYWSLIYGMIAQAIMTTSAYWFFCQFRPGPPSWAPGSGKLVRFGGALVGNNLLIFANKNIDNALIGKVLGATPLAIYSRAYELLIQYINQAVLPITSVVQVGLARLQDDEEAYRKYYRDALMLVTATAMPLVCFSAIAAEPLIFVVLGPNWPEVVPVFRYMAPAAFLAATAPATSWAYVSLGRVKQQLRFNTFASIIIATGFVIRIRWGIVGIAISLSVSQLIIRPLSIYDCFKDTFMRYSDFSRAAVRPFVSALLAAALCYFLGEILVNLAAFTQLILWAAAYGIAYLAIWMILPGGVRELKRSKNLYSLLRQK